MKRLLVLLCLLPCSGCFELMRAPEPPDAATLPTRSEHYDVSDWARVLERSVDDRGRVDYAGLSADPEPLLRYVSLLGRVGPSTHPEQFTTEAQRLAYAINAYNALVMFQVLQRRPLASVGDQKADFFYFTCFPLDGRETNLLDLENEGVRKRFGDPRAHFALNCASAGCPHLPATPFTGARLQQQLARETERFVHEERNVLVEQGTLRLSVLFKWYAEDFEPDPIAWVTARRSDLPPFETVEYRPYDWSLNAQPGRR